jgi:Protein of unknown function (DUF1553)/Protein of unknown function (DUF1549)
MKIRILLLAGSLAAAFWARGYLIADPPSSGDIKNLPSPAEIQQLTVHPVSIQLVGADQSAQLIIQGSVASSGMLQDLTGEVKYEVADPRVVRVTASGRVIPLASGGTVVTARYGDKVIKLPVTARAIEENLPINFPNQIVPIFSKLGCNSGGCHGKSGGQNGFALSLLGFVPELDYQTLVKENRGRRLFPASPDNSLLLLKATGTIAHAGGKRMETDSDEYKLLRRWIASGTPFGRPEDPVVTKISVYPERSIISRFNRQQFSVHAHYSDGSVADVTQRAQYESNDTDVAAVDNAALVRTLDLSGEAAIMARYLGQVATFRATVPLGMKIPAYQFEPKTVVDMHSQKKWQELGIVPSDLCSDEQFIRRVSVDIAGTLPTAAQVKAFLADKNPNKRDKLVDDLLETTEYSYYFANRWADVLRVKRGNQPNRAFGTFSFHHWIKDSIATDKPYDQFAREILAAIGDESKSPAVVWYRDLQKPEQFVDDSCQLFLGVRMACAQCHHHPYEKWSQDDYWGMAAFFGQIGRKNVPTPGIVVQNQNQNRLVIFNKGTGNVINMRTQKTAVMRPLDGEPVVLSAGDDPRQHLVDWMVHDKNPFFARAIANRYWAHFFGRGIVDPIDDMRVTNPPTNPELLDALAKDLVDHKYSLKHLIGTICKSRTYQLSAVPNEFNKHDKRSYARFYPRTMTAEVLFDAVSQLTDSPSSFPGLPADKHAPRRAIMLPDEAFQSYFLDVFGRPQRISACECERVTEANLAQALHLLNSAEIQNKLARNGGRADQMAKDARTDQEKIEELFLWAFARRPSQAQVDFFLEIISRNQANRRLAYEDAVWALLNAKEFRLVQ